MNTIQNVEKGEQANILLFACFDLSTDLCLCRHPNPPQIQDSGCFEVINLQRSWRQLVIPASLPESLKTNKQTSRRVELLCESIFLVPLKVFQENTGIQPDNSLDEGLIKRHLVPVDVGPGEIQQHHHRPQRCRENT